MNFSPKGIIPALITPLTYGGKPAEQPLRRLVEHVIDGGVHGVFVVGTTGEFYGLSLEEKREVLAITIDQTAGRVPVYFGSGAITTKECIALTQMAEDTGADAVSVLTPMFISPTQEELVLHYREIAQNTKLPILLYNNVPKTQVTITAAAAVELASVDNIVGIKDSSGDFSLTTEYIRRTGDRGFHVLAGRDTLIHACLAHGGSGSIAACANVAPRLCADIYDKYAAGDIEGSLQDQYRLAPLRAGFTLGTFPTVIKEALELLGIEAGPCLGPVGPMTAEEKATLREILQGMGLLGEKH